MSIRFLSIVRPSPPTYAVSLLLSCYRPQPSSPFIITTHTHTQSHTSVLWPFSGTTRVRQCQKKSSSGVHGARGDIRGRHTDNPAGCHSIRTNQRPISLPHPPFLCRMLFLPQPYLFILAWGQAPNMLACIPSGSFPFIIITRLIFYHPMEGAWLSRPRHCSNGAQLMLKALSHIGCSDKHNCQGWNSFHTTTALSHVITRPLLPDDDMELVVNFALQHLYQVLVFVTASSFCFFVSFFVTPFFCYVTQLTSS